MTAPRLCKWAGGDHSELAKWAYPPRRADGVPGPACLAERGIGD